MTLKQVCDFAYVIQVDLLEQRIATQQIGSMLAMATGAEGVTVPDPDQIRAEFDAALEAEPPSGVDREQAELAEALGVR